MELSGRISRLELLAERRDPSGPQGVPEAWTRYDATGRMVGPGPGDRPTQGQLQVFELMRQMDRTVLGN